jgi:sec-independent protein translocase protein TatB
MFDIAWSELFVILVVALVVVGPKDLPKLMRKVGQWTGRARSMADQFRRSFDDMARQAELDELRSQVTKMKTAVTNPMTHDDYAALGIDLPKDALGIGTPLIEEVGASPPIFDSPPTATSTTATSAPAPVAAPAAPAGIAPAVQEASPAVAPAAPSTRDTV